MVRADKSKTSQHNIDRLARGTISKVELQINIWMKTSIFFPESRLLIYSTLLSCYGSFLRFPHCFLQPSTLASRKNLSKYARTCQTSSTTCGEFSPTTCTFFLSVVLFLVPTFSLCVAFVLFCLCCGGGLRLCSWLSGRDVL